MRRETPISGAGPNTLRPCRTFALMILAALYLPVLGSTATGERVEQAGV